MEGTSVLFAAQCPGLGAGELLAVSGSCASLGCWEPDRALRLSQDTSSGVWSGTAAVALEPPTEFKLVVLDSQSGRLRAYEDVEANHSASEQQDGRLTLPPVPRKSMRRAWVQPGEAEAYVTRVELLPSPTTGAAAAVVADGVRFTDVRFEHEGKRYTLSGTGRAVEHSVLLPHPLPQPLHLHLTAHYQRGGVPHTHSVVLELPPACTRGVVEQHIEPDLRVRACFLVIEPLAGLPPQLLAEVRPRVARVARFIGHRGSGSTRADAAKDAVLPENTLASFLAASRVAGAGGVEFDVQLTSDGVPVIYHDIFFPVQAAGAVTNPLLPVPVNALTAAEVACLRPRLTRAPLPPRTAATERARDDVAVRSRRELERVAEALEQPVVAHDYAVPTLAELLTRVPAHTSFDCEIKYPDTLAIEDHVRPVERNAYVDTILRVVLAENPGERALFFSSFDTDVCHLVARKQPRHDVFLLSVARECDAPADCNRACEAREALAEAHDMALRGVVTDSAVLQEDPGVVAWAHEHGIQYLTYGALNNDPAFCRKQLAMGVDSIITDYLRRIITGTA